MANLWTSPLWGCTHPESTLAPTSMAPGVGIPNQRLEKRAGTGWWCWRQATNFQTLSVFTPARALSSLAWANQVKTFIATGIYHGWFYEPICNNGAVHIRMQKAQVAHYYSNIVGIRKYNILMQKRDFFILSDSLTMTSTTGKTAYAALQKFVSWSWWNAKGMCVEWVVRFSKWSVDVAALPVKSLKMEKKSVLFYFYRRV